MPILCTLFRLNWAKQTPGIGDSSVHARLIQDVPVWGRDINKVECANHATKCLRSSLEKLVVDKHHYNKVQLLGMGVFAL